MNVSSLRISSWNLIPRGTSTRSPVIAIVGSLAAGASSCRRLAARPGVGRRGAAGHRLAAVRLRARLGAHGGLDDALQHPAAGLYGGARRGPRLDRARPGRLPARPGRDGLPELGLAARDRRPCDLDVRAGPPTAARPRPLVLFPAIATLLVFAIGGGSRPSARQTVRGLLDTGRWSMSAGVASTSNAPARGAPPSSSSRASANRPRTGGASPRPSPHRPPSARTTARATDEATTAAAPQDGIALATDLHSLLERAGVPRPYVVVGHSSGGRTCASSRLAIQTRSPGWCSSTPSRRTRSLRYPITRDLPEPTDWPMGFRASWPASACLGPPSDCPPTSTPAAARGARDESPRFLPPWSRPRRSTVLETDRSVMRAGSGQQAGWLEAQGRLARLVTNSIQRVLPTPPTPRSSPARTQRLSTRAILDVVLDPRRDAAPVNVPGVELTVVAAVVATARRRDGRIPGDVAAAAPIGAHVLGGRYSGVLPPQLRAFSGIAALLLVGFALVVLARAGVVGWPTPIAGLLIPASWAVAGFSSSTPSVTSPRRVASSGPSWRRQPRC